MVFYLSLLWCFWALEFYFWVLLKPPISVCQTCLCAPCFTNPSWSTWAAGSWERSGTVTRLDFKNKMAKYWTLRRGETWGSCLIWALWREVTCSCTRTVCGLGCSLLSQLHWARDLLSSSTSVIPSSRRWLLGLKGLTVPGLLQPAHRACPAAVC